MNRYTYKKEDGTFGLIRCTECHKENYALCVSEGICAWCGYDINKDKRRAKDEDKL